MSQEYCDYEYYLNELGFYVVYGFEEMQILKTEEDFLGFKTFYENEGMIFKEVQLIPKAN